MNALLLAAAAIPAIVQTPMHAVDDKIKIEAAPFPPDRIRLLDSPFKTAQQADLKYLLSLEPDRLLSWFRKNAGLTPKAEPYGGWEVQQLAGHSLGHYLSACSYMFAAAGDKRLKDRADYIVDQLAECQANRKDGYIGAMPDGDALWDSVRRSETGAGSRVSRYWAPWYTLHKQYAGLIDAYQLTGNAKALSVVKKFADWAIETTKGLSPEQWQQMLANEHGGMNEAVANLYGLTGEKKYLVLAERFHHRYVLDPLERGEHKLAGLHGNTQIPKAIGAARLFELTGEDRFRKIAKNFWNQVVDEHTYAIGGNTSGEYFGPPGKLSNRLTTTACETCNTYNMLKLTRHLFEWTPNSKLGDYFERALYNHILASQNPATGMMCYYVSMQPGGRKAFSTPFDSFWCCVGTGMENHARYGDAIYFHGGSKLWVNLYLPSTLDWKEKGVNVRQEGEFPDCRQTTLTFTCAKPTKLVVAFRLPAWSPAVAVSLNGRPIRYYERRDGFGELTETVRTGSTIRLSFKPKLWLEPTPDNPKKVAACFGPFVLAGDLGPADAPNQVQPPAFCSAGGPVEAWVQRDTKTPGVFKTVGVGRPADVLLVPFYRVTDSRYSVYWNLLTEAEWTKREEVRKAEEAHAKAMDARTLDQVRIGSQDSETVHGLQGQGTSSGDFGGRRWRHADGWFSYDLKVDPSARNELLLTFWGSDGGRSFDVFVDETKIASIRLNESHPNVFFDEIYQLDEALTKGKTKVTVKLQAHPGSLAGGLFGLRMLKPSR